MNRTRAGRRSLVRRILWRWCVPIVFLILVVLAVAYGVSIRLPELLAERLTEPLGERLSEPLVERLSEPLAERLAEPLAERLAEPLAERLAEPLAKSFREALIEELELGTRLPEVFAPHPLSMPPSELIVNVTEEGEYLVVGKSYSEEALATLLHQKKTRNPHWRVHVRAHQHVLWESLARVLALCERENIEHHCSVLQETP